MAARAVLRAVELHERARRRASGLGREALRGPSTPHRGWPLGMPSPRQPHHGGLTRRAVPATCRHCVRQAAWSPSPSVAGFSLLELLLVAALGAVLTTAVVQLFASNTRAYAVVGGQARLQESARLAMHFLTGSARAAGYVGCTAAGTLADGLGGSWRNSDQNLTVPVDGHNDVAPGDDMSQWRVGNRDPMPGSDILRFRRLDGTGHVLAARFGVGSELTLAGTFDADADQLAVLSDCGRVGVLRLADMTANGRATLAADVDRNALLADGPFGTATGPGGAIVAPVLTETFFVARSRFVNNRGERGWSLWRVTGRADEVVAGVTDLQVLYAVDRTPGDGDPTPQRYVSADNVGNGAVRAVHIAVTASSVDVVADGQPLEWTLMQTVTMRNVGDVL